MTSLDAVAWADQVIAAEDETADLIADAVVNAGVPVQVGSSGLSAKIGLRRVRRAYEAAGGRWCDHLGDGPRPVFLDGVERRLSCVACTTSAARNPQAAPSCDCCQRRLPGPDVDTAVYFRTGAVCVIVSLCQGCAALEAAGRP